MGEITLKSKLYTVGKIVNTHGVQGEVRVIKMSDYEDRFEVGGTLYLIRDNMDPLHLTIVGHRIHKQFDLIKFDKLSNINDVESFKNGYLKVKEEQLPELAENEFYYHEIIGCYMYTTEGDKIGVISSVLSPGANDVWIVERPKGKDVLIPYIKDVVKNVDVTEKKVIIEVMEGLLD